MDIIHLKVMTILWIALVNLKYGRAVDSGISQFWANDFKSFHQLYGKTSDHDLYGDTLPLSVTHGIEAKKLTKKDASAINYQSFNDPPDSSASSTYVDPFELKDFSQLKRKHVRSRTTQKPVYGPVFADDDVVRDLKNANEATDQATIDYLKQFEHLGTQQAIDFPEQLLTGFKPYTGLFYRNMKNKTPLALDSYKNIQDIIDAQDNYDEVFERQKANHKLAHKAYGKIPKIYSESVDKVTSNTQVRPKKPSVRFNQNNDVKPKPKRLKCSTGRCRSSPTSVRLRKVRPRIRKIHKIVSL